MGFGVSEGAVRPRPSPTPFFRHRFSARDPHQSISMGSLSPVGGVGGRDSRSKNWGLGGGGGVRRQAGGGTFSSELFFHVWPLHALAHTLDSTTETLGTLFVNQQVNQNTHRRTKGGML